MTTNLWTNPVRLGVEQHEQAMRGVVSRGVAAERVAQRMHDLRVPLAEEASVVDSICEHLDAEGWGRPGIACFRWALCYYLGWYKAEVMNARIEHELRTARAASQSARS